MSDRPKVGPADPETRRKALRAALDTPSKATGVATAPAAKPKKKRSAMQEVGDALNPNVRRSRNVEGNNETVGEAVERAVKGAPKPRFD